MKTSSMFNQFLCKRVRDIALLCLGTAAMAQPAEFVDLGNIAEVSSITSADVPIAAGQVKWFKINLVNPITPLERWLDIDTAGPSVIGNSMVGIYDDRGNFKGWDDNSGGGSTGNAAAMSFGGGSGEKLSGENSTWGGGRISDGAWGPNLAAGVYYIAICGYTGTFPFDDPTLYNITTNSTQSGLVRLRVAAGRVETTTWNERFHGDSGETLPTAQVVSGNGPLTKIITAFKPAERDMFKVHISDANTFRVVATPTLEGGGVQNARLFLMDNSGRGVCAVNWTASGPTVVTGLPGLTTGDYYLAVSSYCGGTNGQAAVPYDANKGILWDFVAGGNNVNIRPNGPGASNPMVYFGRQSVCVSNSNDAYYVRLDLTGVSYIPSDCPADYNGDSFLTGDDFDAFVDAFYAGCP